MQYISDQVIYVEWMDTTIHTPGRMGWLTAMIELVQMVLLTNGQTVDEGLVYKILRTELMKTSSVAALARSACVLINEKIDTDIKQFTVQISAFEEIANDDLAACMDHARSGKATALCVMDNGELTIFHICRTIKGQTVVSILDTHAPYSVMHRAILVYLVACLTLGTNPVSLDGVDTESVIPRIREKRVIQKC